MIKELLVNLKIKRYQRMIKFDLKTKNGDFVCKTIKEIF